MKEKEGLTRREAILVGLVYSLAGLDFVGGSIIAYGNRKRLEGLFKGLVASPPEFSSPIEEVQNYLKVDGEGEWASKTQVNKGAFATALCLIALTQDQQNGLQKLREFLWKHRLSIRLRDINELEGQDNSGLGIYYGSYHLLLRDGPAVEYNGPELESYQQAQINRDIFQLKKADEGVFHELGHFWDREIANPPLIMGNRGEADSEEKFEERAIKISEDLMKPLASIHDLKDLPWPYGKFFSFS